MVLSPICYILVIKDCIILNKLKSPSYRQNITVEMEKKNHAGSCSKKEEL